MHKCDRCSRVITKGVVYIYESKSHTKVIICDKCMGVSLVPFDSSIEHSLHILDNMYLERLGEEEGDEYEVYLDWLDYIDDCYELLYKEKEQQDELDKLEFLLRDWE